ncbi:MAG TPA: hypothetical protein VFY29_07440, partial [Terriglobia bacterium]|nr:hypothetical protein [Terriglobia bacterium]
MTDTELKLMAAAPAWATKNIVGLDAHAADGIGNLFRPRLKQLLLACILTGILIEFLLTARRAK